MIVAASATGLSGVIVRAGVDIASPTRTASNRAASHGSAGSSEPAEQAAAVTLAAFFGEDVCFRDNADHLEIVTHDRHPGDPPAHKLFGGFLEEGVGAGGRDLCGHNVLDIHGVSFLWIPEASSRVAGCDRIRGDADRPAAFPDWGHTALHAS